MAGTRPVIGRSLLMACGRRGVRARACAPARPGQPTLSEAGGRPCSAGASRRPAPKVKPPAPRSPREAATANACTQRPSAAAAVAGELEPTYELTRVLLRIAFVMGRPDPYT